MKFTRGAETLDEKGNKGPSMVAQHRTKLQQAREEISRSKLKLLMPNVREDLLDTVLKETDWNVEASLLLLEGFIKVHGEEMKKIDGEMRSRERAILQEAGIDVERHDGDEERRHRRKKRRGHSGHRRSTKRRHGSSDSESSDDEERSRRRRRHRSKRESRYGKYGVIRESDIREKWPEFALWASEVKGVKDVESMARSQEKELFRSFIEDFNTATLPHKKYYDLERYERHKRRSGRDIVDREKPRVFDDEEERRQEVMREKEREKEQRLQEAYTMLKSGDRAADMREQELLRARMKLAYKTGDSETAQKLAEKLRPDPR
eukprot:jgi/Picre1/30640/NNA_006001.t1